MQGRTIRLVCAVAFMAIAIPVFAQYGHPLKGSWSGDWWLVKGQNNHILLDFNFVANGYGNTTLTGTYNPGPDQAPMQKLTLTPPDVISAGKAAIAAREAAQAKQAAEATAAAPAAPPAVATAAPKDSGPIMHLGSSGPSVAALQKKLGEQGFATGETDGTFGKGTDAAVKAFQKSKNLNPDGVVGSATSAALGVEASKETSNPRGATPANAGAATAGRGAAPASKDNVAIASDPWLLHFEVDTKDDAGKAVHYIVDGKMENLGAAYTRVITGTWKVGSKVGNFKVVRN
jgi:peptidoglycan hydrolase-like protein with peptidoglycan-binding domain